MNAAAIVVVELAESQTRECRRDRDDKKSRPDRLAEPVFRTPTEFACRPLALHEIDVPFEPRPRPLARQDREPAYLATGGPQDARDRGGHRIEDVRNASPRPTIDFFVEAAFPGT